MAKRGDDQAVQCKKGKADWLREREFFRYFDPLGLRAFPSSVVPQGEVRIPQSSKDPALTAFAQLGALRLNARRATINLIGKDSHYTVAEATRTLSLQDDKVHDEGDQLQSGCSVRPTSRMFCRYIFDVDPSMTDPLDVRVVVGDLADNRFRGEVPVSDFTPRFFCSVPLRTRNGIYIGSYCVFDDIEREKLSEAHLQFLRDISKTVTAHLEMAIAQQEHRRAEKAVRGIGCFVEGKTSIRDWWVAANGSDQEDAVENDEQEGRMNPEGAEDGKQQAMSRVIVAQRDLTQTPDNAKAQPSSSLARRKQQLGQEKVPKKVNFAVEHEEDTKKENSAPSANNAMFSRAANILREAMELQGVLFVDAAIGTFGGNRATLQSDSTEGAAATTSSSESRSADSDNASKKRNENGNHEDVDCRVLGFSTSGRSSINEKGASDHHAPAASYSIPEGFLKVLLRRYPLGKIFDLTADGTSSSSDSEDRPGLRTKPCSSRDRRRSASQSTVDAQRTARRAERKREQKLSHIEKLRGIFPAARSLVFFPLWDAQKERYFAGAMAWTNQPARIFTIEGELSYFAAFGNTMMAEVARLDTIKADKAKTDFIGSISHELRSPLHGILGSVELLQSSTTDAFQRNIINTVENCSRTLLDTINHLLDFAKINNYTNSQESRIARRDSDITRKTPDGNSAAGMISLSSNTDLSIITEEVIESMFASHHSFMPNENRAGSCNSDNLHSLQGDRQSPNTSPKVTTILDIDHTAHGWTHRAPSGAWRRIFMNLYGNAIKYTNSGFINIRVKRRPTASGSSRVTLMIGDSGQGMSEEFQRSHMFTPFTQEDALMPGTGLGLSLCKQIVKSLGGSMKVNSRKGYGTEIKVSITLSHADAVSDASERESVEMVKAARTKLRGCKIAFGGFESDDATEMAQAPAPVKAGAALHRIALQKLCADWFDLEVADRTETQDSDYIVVDSIDLAQKMILEAYGPEAPPIVVVCESPSIALAQWQEERSNGVKRIVEYISQPVGPRKLAQALLSCKHRLTPNDEDVPLQQSNDFSPIPRRRSDEITISVKRRKSGMNIRALLADAHPGINMIPSLSSNQSTSSCSESSTFNFTIHPDDNCQHPDMPTTIIGSPQVLSPSASEVTTPSIEKPENQPLSPPLLRQNSSSRSISSSTNTTATETSSDVLVLVVDDNPINLKLLSTFMTRVRVPYATAENGLIAVQEYKRLVLANRTVNCVFMDINMPVMDGMTATREIRAFEREVGVRSTSIIALTGLASAEAQRDAFTSGINLFLTKPVRLKEIRALLERL